MFRQLDDIRKKHNIFRGTGYSQNLMVIWYCCQFSWLFSPQSSLYPCSGGGLGVESSLTDVHRSQIVTLQGEGHSERDIAAKLLQDSGAQCCLQIQC